MSGGTHRAPRHWGRLETPRRAGTGEGRPRAETVGPAGEWEEETSQEHSPAGPRHQWPVDPSPEQIAEARAALAEYAERFPLPLPASHPDRRLAILCQLLTVMHSAAATLDAALHVRELDELQDYDEERFFRVPG